MPGGSSQEAWITVAKSRKKGPRLEIETDGGQVFRLPAATVLAYGIFVGHRFRAERWTEILARAEEEECFGTLMSLLNRRAHTTLEMRRKLFQREFSSSAVVQAQTRAAAAGLLDDAAFARAFVDERSRDGRYGRRRIEADLGRRGVDRQVIRAAFEHLEEETGHGADQEYQSALGAAGRKWQQLVEREADPYKRRHKLLGFLANRGFGADVAYRVLDHLAGGGNDDYA